MAITKETSKEYQEWLKNANIKDSKKAREWFNCPENKRAEWIAKNKTWWDKFHTEC